MISLQQNTLKTFLLNAHPPNICTYNNHNNMTEPYTENEERYIIEQRVREHISKHGSAEKAIAHIKDEVKWCEDNWGHYSCDCVGHAITCGNMLINRLYEHINLKP